MLETIALTMPDGKSYNLPCFDRRIYLSRTQCTKVLPSTPGLYFYISDDSQVCYIGVASNLASRAIDYHQFRRRGANKAYYDLVSATSTNNYWNGKIAIMPFSNKYKVIAMREKKGQSEPYFIASKELYYLEMLCIFWFQPCLNGKNFNDVSCINSKTIHRWNSRLPLLAKKYQQFWRQLIKPNFNALNRYHR